MGYPQVSFLTHNRYDPVTGCWNWMGCKMKTGYGQMNYGGKNERVHRVAAHIWLGFDLSSKLCVLHKCDNRLCFNPKHLFIGTQLDNLRDQLAKGRNPRASKTHCVKGHPLSGSNLYIKPREGGRIQRVCLICRREQAYKDNLKRRSL